MSEPAPQRVLIIGSGGSGKTTLARHVADELGIPLIHLDQHYWHPGWAPTADDDWAAEVEKLIGHASWVMDGNYGGTLNRRLERAEAVIWLDLPRWLCLLRVLRRQLRYLGRSRPELPVGCRERLSFEFLLWIWNYPTRRAPSIAKRLAELPSSMRVVRLRSPNDVRHFLQGLPEFRYSDAARNRQCAS
jgi:adenylate kinase family enzyme